MGWQCAAILGPIDLVFASRFNRMGSLSQCALLWYNKGLGTRAVRALDAKGFGSCRDVE